jgi:hypothetical protein
MIRRVRISDLLKRPGMVKAGAGYILKVALELLAELSKLSRCAPVRVP